MSLNVPKIIWILWWQGVDKAPELVKACISSWQLKNPGWEIKVLDQECYKQYADLYDLYRHYPDVTLQVQADLLRLKLLQRYGGVWADATCYCQRPLDEWLPTAMPSGFFAFYKPHKTRLMANWFLAAEPNNDLVNTMHCTFESYFINNQLTLSGRNRYVAYILGRILNSHRVLTQVWFWPFVVRRLQIYPYFCFHYLFAELVKKNQHFAKVWAGTKKISASDSHLMQRIGLLSKSNESIQQRLCDSSIPMHKLTWRVSLDDAPPTSVIAKYTQFQQEKAMASIYEDES